MRTYRYEVCEFCGRLKQNPSGDEILLCECNNKPNTNDKPCLKGLIDQLIKAEGNCNYSEWDSNEEACENCFLLKTLGTCTSVDVLKMLVNYLED